MSATIAARAHSSDTLSAPAKRRPVRSRAYWLLRILRTMAHRPGQALIMLLFSAVAAAILVNALMFQKARRPAPISAATISAAPATTQPARAVERRAEPAAPIAVQPQLQPVPATGGSAAPHPPARPSDLPASAREASPRPPAAVTSVPRTAAAPAAPAPAARSAAARDPIADLINGADLRPPAEIRGVAAAKPRRSVEN